MAKFTYSVVIQKVDEDEYAANVPAFPGCSVSGSSEEEAIEEAQNMVKGFISQEYGQEDPLPQEITERIEVKLEGKVLKYTAFFFPMGSSEYKVLIPLLPGCVEKGKTYEEALGNIKKTISHFATIPTTKELFVEENIKKIDIEIGD